MEGCTNVVSSEDSQSSASVHDGLAESHQTNQQLSSLQAPRLENPEAAQYRPQSFHWGQHPSLSIPFAGPSLENNSISNHYWPLTRFVPNGPAPPPQLKEGNLCVTNKIKEECHEMPDAVPGPSNYYNGAPAFHYWSPGFARNQSPNKPDTPDCSRDPLMDAASSSPVSPPKGKGKTPAKKRRYNISEKNKAETPPTESKVPKLITPTPSPSKQPKDKKEAQPVQNEVSLAEVQELAKLVKHKRVSLGLTQHDVGYALGLLYGQMLSQTTICRFESMQLSLSNMRDLMPILQRWLRDVEKNAKAIAEIEVCVRIPPLIVRTEEVCWWLNRDTSNSKEVFILQVEQQWDRLRTGKALWYPELSLFREFCSRQQSVEKIRKRKKRTNIPKDRKHAMEQYYSQNQKPGQAEINVIAQDLNLSREVIRVWFCNRRQKGKQWEKEHGVTFEAPYAGSSLPPGMSAQVYMQPLLGATHANLAHLKTERSSSPVVHQGDVFQQAVPQGSSSTSYEDECLQALPHGRTIEHQNDPQVLHRNGIIVLRGDDGHSQALLHNPAIHQGGDGYPQALHHRNNIVHQGDNGYLQAWHHRNLTVHRGDGYPQVFHPRIPILYQGDDGYPQALYHRSFFEHQGVGYPQALQHRSTIIHQVGHPQTLTHKSPTEQQGDNGHSQALPHRGPTVYQGNDGHLQALPHREPTVYQGDDGHPQALLHRGPTVYQGDDGHPQALPYRGPTVYQDDDGHPQAFPHRSATIHCGNGYLQTLPHRSSIIHQVDGGHPQALPHRGPTVHQVNGYPQALPHRSTIIHRGDGYPQALPHRSPTDQGDEYQQDVSHRSTIISRGDEHPQALSISSSPVNESSDEHPQALSISSSPANQSSDEHSQALSISSSPVNESSDEHPQAVTHRSTVIHRGDGNPQAVLHRSTIVHGGDDGYPQVSSHESPAEKQK